MTTEEKEEIIDQDDLCTVPVEISVTKKVFGSVYNGTITIDNQRNFFTATFYRPLGCIDEEFIKSLEESPAGDLMRQMDRLFNIRFVSSRREYINVPKTNKNIIFILSTIVDTIFQLEESNEERVEKNRTLVSKFMVDEDLIPVELSPVK